MSANRQCGTCRHFHTQVTSFKSVVPSAGECRAAPPRVLLRPLRDEFSDARSGSGWRIWPAVDRGDWCAAWTARGDRGVVA